MHEAFNDVMEAPLTAQVQEQASPLCIQLAWMSSSTCVRC